MATTVLSAVGKKLTAAPLANEQVTASQLLNDLLDESAYVGDAYSLGYAEALVRIHDKHRQRVGGIPALSFLLATRTTTDRPVDVRQEDASVVLLRVLDQADLPTHRTRCGSGSRTPAASAGSSTSTGTTARRWTRRPTRSRATQGGRCRVLGAFYVADGGAAAAPPYRLAFGSDVGNYYPNKGLKVFEPRGDVLRRVANYRDPRLGPAAGALVPVGHVRYASTRRPFQQVGDVPVALTPTDLLGQETALFGMTRSGKSNTTKIILQSIFALRWQSDPPVRAGRLVFDPTGEYANENVQDGGPAITDGAGDEQIGAIVVEDGEERRIRIIQGQFVKPETVDCRSSEQSSNSIPRSASRARSRGFASSSRCSPSSSASSYRGSPTGSSSG